MPTTGITSNTETRMMFGAGALIRNYNNIGQEIIGATRGGSEFSITREDRDIPIDGLRGSTKGFVRTVGTTVVLTTVLPEISDDFWQEVTRGSKSTNGSRSEITPPEESKVAASEYLTNVALVAEEFDTGDEKAVILENVLVDGEWNVSYEDLGEAGIEVTFKAHYLRSNLDKPPYRIGSLFSLLRDWSPEEDLSGQTLTEKINAKDATLGSTAGSDTNDPTWQNSPPALVFGEDDYVTESSTIWTT